LLHLTSLPGRFGVGDLGRSADWFLDVMAETGQRWWQMLPVGPIGPGDTPNA
jgi:4-alpha-glucanotransferase